MRQKKLSFLSKFIQLTSGRIGVNLSGHELLNTCYSLSLRKVCISYNLFGYKKQNHSQTNAKINIFMLSYKWTSISRVSSRNVQSMVQ